MKRILAAVLVLSLLGPSLQAGRLLDPPAPMTIQRALSYGFEGEFGQTARYGESVGWGGIDPSGIGLLAVATLIVILIVNKGPMPDPSRRPPL